MSDAEKSTPIDTSEIQLKSLLAEKEHSIQVLEQKNRELSQYIWSGNLGTWDWNVVSGRISFNEHWAMMFGFGNEAMSLDFEEWQSLIHPDDRESLMKSLNDCIEGKSDSYEINHRKITKVGDVKWLVLSGKVAERNTLGKAARIIGIHQDITDKKNALESQIYTERLNTSVFEAMQEGIVIQGMDGTILSCNKSAEQILGLTHDQIIGRTSIDPRWNAIKEDGSPFPGEEHPAMVTIRTGLPQDHVTMGLNKPDGSLTWISISSVVVPNTDVLFCLFYDITEIKKVSEQYQQQYYTLKGINESSSNAIFSIDTNYRYTSFNKTHKGLIKMLYGVDIQVGQNALNALTDTEKIKASEKLDKALQGQQVIQVDYFGEGPEIRCFEVIYNPIRNDEGEVVGVAFFSIDITEKKEAESKMSHLLGVTQSQNQRLAEYSYITSHNIRTSVANMIGLFDLIQEKNEDKKLFSMLEVSVHQLDETIKTMNDLLDIEYNSENLPKDKIQLLGAVKNNLNLLQFQLQDVQLEMDVPEILSVSVVPAYLDSILNNLLSNAIKYRKEDNKPIIKMKAYQEEQATIFTIEDNGIGIDLENSSHKLFKLKSRLTTKVPGKGIGLYLTKFQVEAMGGKITVESTPDIGSTFKVYFYE